MNKKLLKKAESEFLTKYPGGFMHPELQVVLKKHKVDKMLVQAQEFFAPSRFKDIKSIADDMSKIVSRSSMVSMFEKPKFRDCLSSLTDKETEQLTQGLKNFLHGQQEKGFEAMVNCLSPKKLAKWSIITIIPNYYSPDDEVFVKPTTAKGVIEYFQLQDLKYHATPSWNFYQKYREEILKMKAMTDSSLAPNNAAFCGFLMSSLKIK